MAILKHIEYEKIDFEFNSSQQFATVVFDRAEDEEEALITVIKGGMINQFKGSNEYNPSNRRRSTCVYVEEECEGGKVIKICTIQHKGITLLEVHSVDQAELEYLFKNT